MPSEKGPSRFAWSDAWVLWSIATSAGPSTTLRQLIAAADYINHAVPTYDELAGALRRLEASGCVERGGRGYRATPLVREFSERPQRANGLDEVNALWAFLETLTEPNAIDVESTLSPDAYRRAVKDYLRGH